MYIVGGKYKKRALVAPKSDLVRPTTSQTRESVFNICQLTIEGAQFLDLFAGSGAMGLEALSRGAEHATFVENNKQALIAIKQNIQALGVEKQTTVMHLSVLQALQKLALHKKTFDVIYVDPPYGKGLCESVITFLDQHPLLNEGGTLFIEDASLKEPDLVSLVLESKRTIGRACLYEYKGIVQSREL